MIISSNIVHNKILPSLDDKNLEIIKNKLITNKEGNMT
mgnify:FL=1